jgi:hypothetical protein
MRVNSSLALSIVLTLVQVRRSARSSAETASLVSDYLAFDRRRMARRQYLKAFGGMALVVLLGGAFGRVPADQAWIVAGLLLVLPLSLVAIEMIQWRRLMRRLNAIRAQVREVRKS